MKKFSEYLEESLADEVKSEPKTKAAKQARQMGLTYMGFGRYADKTGKVAYLVHNDQLFPVEHSKTTTAMFTQMLDKKNPEKASLAASQYKQAANIRDTRMDADFEIVSKKQKEARAVHKALLDFYKRNTFDNKEQETIQWYTADGYENINRYLYKGHDEDTDDEERAFIEDHVERLDDAFDEMEAPFPYTVYTGLSPRYNAKNFKKGGEYIFRGYVSTSLDFQTSIDTFTENDMRTDSPVVLQVDLKKGQKSIYVDGLSANSGELETLLPRGSRIKVLSGPHPIHDEAVSDRPADNVIMLFHCTLVDNEDDK